MVDVSTWNFSPSSSAFLVGPVVGRVTATTARMMVEASSDCTATVSVLSDSKAAGGPAVSGVTATLDDVQVGVASTMEMRLLAKKPAAIELSGLPTGKRVQVTIKIGTETRMAAFTTPDPARKDWHVGLVSCNKISTMKDIGLWERLAKAAPEIDVILHMGDQVYGDEDFHRGAKQNVDIDSKQEAQEGCWGKCRALVTAEDVGTNWEPLREKCKQIYANLYRATWSHPPTASALASVSNLMVLDDHEIVDDTGDVPEHLDPTTWQFFVMGCAYQAYLAYQAQLNGPVKDVDDMEQKVYYHTELFPGVGMMMLDVRLQRSLHREQQKDADWTDSEYLGPRQFEDIKRSLEVDFKDCTTVILVSPTPILFVSSVAASVIVLKSDDIIGSWSNAKFKGEQQKLLQLVDDWQAARPTRAICLASGDIHIGGFADVQLESGCPILNQFVASAIGNLPEASVGALNLVGAPLLAMADAHVSMRVAHTDWVFEPNYGILHIGPPKGEGPSAERPTLTGELFSKEKKIEHEFQYTIEGGALGELVHGCKCCSIS